MNAAAWIALATGAIGLLAWLIRVSFSLGTLTEKVRNLEARKDGSDCTAALAAMEATLKGLQAALEHRIGSLETAVSNLLMPKAPRRRAGGE